MTVSRSIIASSPSAGRIPRVAGTYSGGCTRVSAWSVASGASARPKPENSSSSSAASTARSRAGRSGWCSPVSWARKAGCVTSSVDIRPHSSGNVTEMPTPSALVCVRCSARYPIDRFADDCPACRAKGAPANLTVAYDRRPGEGLRQDALQRRDSMWRWDDFLHATAAEAVSLGEGNTPLLPAPSLGLGDVWIKDESRNPTWSFKDRLGSGALTMAKRFGAKVVVSSSTGNVSAAPASYASKARLPCVVFPVASHSGPLGLQMRAYGATLVK